jgi:hypothetical protein
VFRENSWVKVYGVLISGYGGESELEAMFSTEAAAFEYAQRRSGEGYRTSGSVTCWELDKPGRRSWLMIYQSGQPKHRNDRLRQAELDRRATHEGRATHDRHDSHIHHN